MQSIDLSKIQQFILLGLCLGLEVLFWEFSKGLLPDYFILILFFIFNFLFFFALIKVPKSNVIEKFSKDLVSNNHIPSSINGISFDIT